MDRKILDDLSEQLARLAPQARAAGEDVRQTLSASLQKGFARMDLLTREEFEQQALALVRAQQRIDALEQTVKQLEQRLAALEPGQTEPPAPD